ncbi:MAG: tetratricopeptide repeat protein [Bacteroidales bacterium]|nr:tetratricopeptide repeat protein [Bacteroidales bacterium]
MLKIRNNKYRIIVTFLAVLMLSSCSTKKNKWNRRVYHNMTSHYNVWWNGDQSVKEGEKSLIETVKDDYTNILPVFNYGTKENALSLNSQMDRAIEKSSICIQRHSMYFNGKEYVKWIDDSYLLMAKANFYKQEYIPARRTFDYVANSYKGDDITYVADLWLAKTYIETEQYPKAESILQSLIVTTSENDKMPKYVRNNLDLVLADYYIKTKRYDDAVKYLKSALLKNIKKNTRARTMFILGQIYEYQGENAKATEQFKSVIRKHPGYEMTFESQMNLAKCHDSKDTSDIMKMFWRMLKDTKNTEYKDRIFYAMSDVALKNHNEELGIKYLRKSVATSTSNNKQKVKSSLKVASMLFDNKDYVLSQAYYDTVVMTMDRSYPEYDSLLNLSVMLSDLVDNLTTYQLQDSLLRLASMDSVTRTNIILGVIEEYKAEQERLEKEKELQEQLALLGGDQIADPNMSAPMSPGSTASWYFYNQTSLTRGATEFRNKWGNRTLEDFWFISNKKSMMTEEEAFENELLEYFSEEELSTLSEEEIESLLEERKNENPADTAQYQPTEIGYYLQQLPFSEKQKKEANQQILDALNNIGYIYYDNLEDYNNSIESFTELNERYPGNKHELSSWYYLYKMYNSQKNSSEANIYKDKILAKYPDSNQAKIIIDPEYFVKEQEKGKESSNLYAETFEAHKNGQYQKVRANVNVAREICPNDTLLMPRFEFLDAIAVGNIYVVDSMAYSLYRLIQKYPTSSIKPHALDILLKANEMYNLGLPVESARQKEKEPEKEYPYTDNPDDKYYVMIICNTKNVRVNPLKVRLNDFNKDSFRMMQLEVKNVMLSKQEAIVTIEEFDNESKADDYKTAMFLTDYLFGGISQEHYKVLLISKSNYPIFFNNKNVDEYIEFLNK